MARILRITPEMAGVPATAPLARQTSTPSGWETAAAAAKQLSGAVQTAGHEILYVQAAIQAQDAKLDMQEAFNTLKQDMAVRDSAMRLRIAADASRPGGGVSDMNGGVGQPQPASTATGTDLVGGTFEEAPPLGIAPAPGAAAPTGALGPAGVLSNLPALLQQSTTPEPAPLQPKDYYATYNADLDKMVDASAKSLRYPGSERQYRALIAPFVGAAKIDALNRGIKIQHSMIMLKDDMTARTEENTYVTDPDPVMRQRAFDSRVNRINGFVAAGLLSGEEAAAKLQQFRHNVDRGVAVHTFTNGPPKDRLFVQQKLLSGTWATSMPVAEQIGLAHTLQNQSDADEARRSALEEKKFKDAQRAAFLDMSNKATDKTTSITEIRDMAVAWRWTATEKEHLEKLYAAPPVEPPSDSAVLADAVTRVYVSEPTITEAGLMKLYDPKNGTGLNTKNYTEMAAVLASNVRHMREHGHTLQMQRYTQGEQELMLAFGVVPGTIENLTKEGKQVLNLALREYRADAFPLEGKAREDPFQVMSRVVTRYKGAITTIGLAPEAIRETLKFPVRGLNMSKDDPDGAWKVIRATGDALEDAYRRGTIDRSTYDTEKEKWADMVRGVNERTKRNTQTRPEAQDYGTPGRKGAPPGTPKYKPSGVE